MSARSRFGRNTDLYLSISYLSIYLYLYIYIYNIRIRGHEADVDLDDIEEVYIYIYIIYSTGRQRVLRTFFFFSQVFRPPNIYIRFYALCTPLFWGGVFAQRGLVQFLRNLICVQKVPNLCFLRTFRPPNIK